MSTRTCQLCGKPLSRIWVGAGGDFCSREHRNQYRLRLGMDRLQEANKVATLMRRRENPKPIQPGYVQSAFSPIPRGFLKNETWPRELLTGRAVRRMQPDATARVTAIVGDFILPQPRAASTDAVARVADCILRGAPAQCLLGGGLRSREQAVSLPRAGAVRPPEKAVGFLIAAHTACFLVPG